MSIQKLKATDNTPEILFDYDKNFFRIADISYPENVGAFYDPLLEKLHAHLSELKDAKIEFQFEMVYFNSASAKVFHNLLFFLDEIAGKGNEVVIEWVFEEDDDNMEEIGEEFAEDIENATFTLKKIDVD